jgi:hypothetical protein
MMKLKALARLKGKKCRTYIVETLKREIRMEEERLASAKLKRNRRPRIRRTKQRADGVSAATAL